jgi:hypothetical protein
MTGEEIRRLYGGLTEAEEAYREEVLSHIGVYWDNDPRDYLTVTPITPESQPKRAELAEAVERARAALERALQEPRSD